MRSKRLFLSSFRCRSCVIGFLVGDGAPDEEVGDEEVDEGEDAGGDQPRPVEVVEDVLRVLPQCRDVVVHHLRPEILIIFQRNTRYARKKITGLFGNFSQMLDFQVLLIWLNVVN